MREHHLRELLEVDPPILGALDRGAVDLGDDLGREVGVGVRDHLLPLLKLQLAVAVLVPRLEGRDDLLAVRPLLPRAVFAGQGYGQGSG